MAAGPLARNGAPAPPYVCALFYCCRECRLRGQHPKNGCSATHCSEGQGGSGISAWKEGGGCERHRSNRERQVSHSDLHVHTDHEPHRALNNPAGQQEGFMVQRPDFYSWLPYGIRELTLTSCPVSSTQELLLVPPLPSLHTTKLN